MEIPKNKFQIIGNTWNGLEAPFYGMQAGGITLRHKKSPSAVEPDGLKDLKQGANLLTCHFSN